MNIFQVAGGEKEVDDPNNSNQVKGTLGNTDISKITEGQAAPVVENQNKVTPQGENPMVVIDGPLGRAYTQALNLAFANEDVGSMAMIIDAQKRSDDNSSPVTGTFVYAMDGDKLGQKDCVQAANWMSQQQTAGHKNIVISLESHSSISPKSRQIEDFAKSVGAKVVYSQKALVNHLKSKGF